MPARLTNGPTLYVTLRPYLESLEALERSKGEADRKQVPSIDELAEEVGVSRTALYNVAGNANAQLNLRLGGRLIIALRRRGFPTQITDLLALRE